ncbi:penicillin-binding transpeptidase domain-containing protein [Candidatus Korobacter versatilis]|nr:penicillin-binding transpeptidase domain-containing protein [Candidatus Koribacter versatilis]
MDRAFDSQQGAAVVLRVSDGQVLAAHNRKTLTTRVATPGSAIKPFTLELLLERDATTPQQTIACKRSLNIEGHRLVCSHPAELSEFDAEEALAFSCNSYFVTAATRLKPGELERHFEEHGFTRAPGILPDEGAGRITPERTVEDRQLLAVGAAGIQVTPVEMAAAYLQMARWQTGKATAPQQVVLNGLRAAVEHGLAQGAQPSNIKIAAKTGTSADPRNPQTHAWLAGFAPAEHPEIVVVVFVERGRGSTEAAAIARSIFESYAEEKR